MVSHPVAASLLLHVGEREELLREVSAALSSENHTVSLASVDSVAEARRRLGQGDVDCLVCEGGLDDGIAFLDETRADYPGLPCLFVTGDAGLVDDALASGASDVFVERAGTDSASLLTRRLENVLQRAPAPTLDAQLRRERTFSDLLLDTLDDVFYLVGPDGDMERWNESLRTVTGYTDEEIAEMQALDFFEGEDADRVADAIEETLADGTAKVEADLVTRDGQTIPFVLTGAKLTDADGNLRGLVGIGRDVSERKELERELRRKASLLDHIFNQVPTALYVKDTEGRHVRMSEYHQDPDGAIGKTDREIYGETKFTASTYADDMRVIERGETIVNKEEYNPADEEWTLTSKVPWRDEDGDVQGLIGVSRIVTEKKEYERKLNLRNRAMEEAPVGITIHDAREPSNPVTYANSEFEALTGYDKETAEGSDLSVLAGPETDPDQFAALETAFDDGEATSLVLLLYRADETPFWGRVSIAPVTGESGDLTHFVGFLQDVTDTKEHAEEIERRLNEFGEVIAEEVRTPLRDAKETIRTLAAEDPTPPVEDAMRSLQHVDKLIKDLATVHSFSVKSREVFETAPTDGGGDE